MNVHPESERFGEVVSWDSLTEAEKASGEWIELPDVSGEPSRARRKTVIEKAFGVARFAAVESRRQREIEDAVTAVWTGRKR